MITKLFFEDIFSEGVENVTDIFVYIIGFIIFGIPCVLMDLLLSPLEMLCLFIYYVMKIFGRI